MKMKKKLVIIFIFLTLVLPALSLADWKDDWGGLKTTAQDGAGLKYIDIALFIGFIIRAVLSTVGVIILIFMVYGGYLWMASGGNEQMVKKAKDILTNAAIGLIIVLAAYAITTFVVRGITGAIQSNSTSTTTNNTICSIYNTDGTRTPKPVGSLCNIDGQPGVCNETSNCIFN